MKKLQYTYKFDPEMYKYILSTNILNKKKNEDKIFKNLVEGYSWAYTYNKLSDLAQIEARMMDDSIFVRKYLDSNYKRIPTNNITVGELSGLYNDDILLITMKGHITCSLYGTIYDSFDCRARKVEYAWLVK